MAFGEEAGTAAGNEDIEDNVDDLNSGTGGTSGSAADDPAGDDDFGDDDSFQQFPSSTTGPTGTGEGSETLPSEPPEAEDLPSTGPNAGVDTTPPDDDDPAGGGGDPTPPDPQTTGGADGGPDDTTTETAQQPPQDAPAAPPIKPQVGDTVTGTEAQAVLKRVQRTGRPVQNVEERDALAAQLARITGTDARTVNRSVSDDDVNVTLDESGLTARATRDVTTRAQADVSDSAETRRQDAPGSAEQAQDLIAGGFVTPVNQALEDDVGSAERAQDLAAAGVELGGRQPEDAAEGAQDLGASGFLDPFNRIGPDARAATNIVGGAQLKAFREQGETVTADEGAPGVEDELVQDTDQVLSANDAVGTGRKTVATNAPPSRSLDLGDVPIRLPKTARTRGLAAGDTASTGFRSRPTQTAGTERLEAILNRNSRQFQSDVAAVTQGVEVTTQDVSVGQPSEAVALGRDPGATDAPVVRGLADTADVNALAASAKEATETGAFVVGGGLDDIERRTDIAAGQAAVAAQRGEAAAAKSPIRTATAAGAAAAAGLGAGAASSRALGAIARGTRDRVRTFGGQRIDPTDLTSEDVIRFQETGGRSGTQFPGADNPDLFRSEPDEAVRRQADRNTPDEIEEQFSGDEGVAVKKALDVAPEGPEGARAAGFKTQEGSFESPGGFVGPELSPNFLRIQSRRGGASLRPGLPDLGGRPTAVVARTRVEQPDADTLPELNRELLEREGETTAVTKPPSEVNTGEIEAILPPNAEFVPASDADFFTTIAGRRVPVRVVEPADDVDGASVDADSATRPEVETEQEPSVQADEVRGQTLEDLSERVEPPEDRAIPTSLEGSSAEAASASAGQSLSSAVNSLSSGATSTASNIASGVRVSSRAGGRTRSGVRSAAGTRAGSAGAASSVGGGFGSGSGGSGFGSSGFGGSFGSASPSPSFGTSFSTSFTPSQGGGGSFGDGGGGGGGETTRVEEQFDPDDENRDFDSQIDEFDRVDAFGVVKPKNLDDVTADALSGFDNADDIAAEDVDFTEQ